MRVLNCPCCDGICGPQSGCNCTPCQKLDRDQLEKEQEHIKGRYPPSDYYLDSWTWGPQPTLENLQSCLESIVNEQNVLCLDAASTTLSASRIHQRFMVVNR